MRDLKASSNVPTRLLVRIRIPTMWLILGREYPVKEMTNHRNTRVLVKRLVLVSNEVWKEELLAEFYHHLSNLLETSAFLCMSARLLSSRNTSASSNKTTISVSPRILSKCLDCLPHSQSLPRCNTLCRC
jgi:hypothetical protein